MMFMKRSWKRWKGFCDSFWCQSGFSTVVHGTRGSNYTERATSTVRVFSMFFKESWSLVLMGIYCKREFHWEEIGY
jgi:hypothetical protein